MNITNDNYKKLQTSEWKMNGIEYCFLNDEFGYDVYEEGENIYIMYKYD